MTVLQIIAGIALVLLIVVVAFAKSLPIDDDAGDDGGDE